MLALQFQLRIQHYPKKTEVWFRYDPPVLIVAVTLHNEDDSFCRLLRQHISVRYRKNSESVCIASVIYQYPPDRHTGDAFGGRHGW